MAIPEFPKEYFFEGLTTLLQLDKDWVKKPIPTQSANNRDSVFEFMHGFILNSNKLHLYND